MSNNVTTPDIDPGEEHTLAEWGALIPGVGKAAREYYGQKLQSPSGDRRIRWTGRELAEAEFPDPIWAVPDILPAGLSFLGGRPKLGKSWLALQIAHAVATGGVVLSKRVEKGRVLFLALEDSPRRLKGRLNKQGVPPSEDIVFFTQWNALSGGAGLAELQAEIEHGDYRLVIIDTLSRAIGKADQMDQTDMTIVVGNLQFLAQKLNIAVLVIDHHRKNNGFESSPIDDILGATAKAAVADGALGLYREQGKREAALKITGRDIEESEIALSWDGELCCWQSLGSADDVRKDSLKGDILEAIKALADDDQVATTKRIARFIGKSESLVSRYLGELWAAGKVSKGEKQGKEVPYVLR